MNIINPSDPVLRRKAKKVTRFDGKLQNLIDNMIETMHDAPGIGLAAPQVSESLRLFVAHVEEDPDDENNAVGGKKELWGRDVQAAYLSPWPCICV